MQLLVTGSNGQLGWELCRQDRIGKEIVDNESLTVGYKGKIVENWQRYQLLSTNA